MKVLVKIIVGVLVLVVVNISVFAADKPWKTPCKDPEKIQTSVLIDAKNQDPYCFFTYDWSAFCEAWLCKDLWTTKANNISSTQLRVFTDGTSWKHWMDLIQTYLSIILSYVLKFWAMLAVLAIVVWWIQVSMSMENESKWPWKEKIIWWIAALLVLFFAWVILHFINPNYYVW